MKIVLFCFAGRRANLEAQRPFIDRVLDEHPEATYDVWDLTRTPEDGEYVRSLDGQHEGRVRVLTQLHPGHPISCGRNSVNRRGRCQCVIHKPPYEKPYDWYAADESYSDTVFVKLDDDVVFFETDRFGDLLSALADHPNAVISANVVNNVVCAKYDPDLRPLATDRFGLGSHTHRLADKPWWWLHTDPKFARLSHEWFLDNFEALTDSCRKEKQSVRSRPGEGISINMIAFTHPTMKRLSKMIANEERLGDEGAVDRLLPRIATGFRAAHLTFGPQDAAMTPAELDDLRSRYAAVAKGYLG